MKTTLGVGISVLSALAAQGKDFDRTELNAMLDRLAASPEPKIEPQAIAMCYKMALPTPKSESDECYYWAGCNLVTKHLIKDC